MRLMLEINKKIPKLADDTLIIDKKIMMQDIVKTKILSNVEYKYFRFVNVVPMPSIDSNVFS